jgi:hypothetical protein
MTPDPRGLGSFLLFSAELERFSVCPAASVHFPFARLIRLVSPPVHSRDAAMPATLVLR